MKHIILLAGIIVAVTQVQAQTAANLAELSKEAKTVIQPFASNLQATLKKGMQESGPEGAILVCNTDAPELAEQASENGWTVGRTSLKTRNSDNRPDQWELETLLEFEQRKAAGEDPMSIAKAQMIEGEFRFMKAIPTAEACTACHGTSISEPVQAKLSTLYPEDQATGFSAGDLRGAFTLRKVLE